KFSAINPTGSLALEILNTYERLAPTVRDRRAVVESIMDIAADGRYAAAVRARALEVVKGVVSGGK
ncbi:HEAT repeat domain-containing protein, partial [Treponema pallidum]